MDTPIATLLGFPFFYAIPIDGQIRDIPSQPQSCTEKVEQEAAVTSDDNDGILQLPARSKPLRPIPSHKMSSTLPAVQEADEAVSTLPIVSDYDMITPVTVLEKTEIVVPKHRKLRQRIRHLSLEIGKWSKPSKDGDFSRDAKGNRQTSEIMQSTKRRSLSRSSSSSSGSSVKLPSIAPTSITTSTSTASVDLPWRIDTPISELSFIDTVINGSPFSPSSKLDSTPVSSFSSQQTSPQPLSRMSMRETKRPKSFQISSPQPSELSMTEIRRPRSATSTTDYTLQIYIAERSSYRSWWTEDVPHSLDPPPPQSVAISDPPPDLDYSPTVYSPSIYSPSIYSPSVYSPSVYSPSIYSPPVYSSTSFSLSSRDFQGDIKEDPSIPSLSSLPARPNSILRMTEEEVAQAQIIEDIFLMLHELQPEYLHPVYRPKPNIVRASMTRSFAVDFAVRTPSPGMCVA